MAAKVLVATYSAVGGPKTPKREDDGFMAGPTDPGRYRVARYGRHTSFRYRRVVIVSLELADKG
jgi:hypothetical protein